MPVSPVGRSEAPPAFFSGKVEPPLSLTPPSLPLRSGAASPGPPCPHGPPAGPLPAPVGPPGHRTRAPPDGWCSFVGGWVGGFFGNRNPKFLPSGGCHPPGKFSRDDVKILQSSVCRKCRPKNLEEVVKRCNTLCKFHLLILHGVFVPKTRLVWGGISSEVCRRVLDPQIQAAIILPPVPVTPVPPKACWLIQPFGYLPSSIGGRYREGLCDALASSPAVGLEPPWGVVQKMPQPQIPPVGHTTSNPHPFF